MGLETVAMRWKGQIRLETAATVGGVLQHVAEPALCAATTYYHYTYNKTWLPGFGFGSGVMLLVNSVATTIFAPKAIENSYRASLIRTFIPLGSLTAAALVSFVNLLSLSQSTLLHIKYLE
jgi:hypothetical protein